MFVALSEFAEQVEETSSGRHAPINMRAIAEEMAAQADPARGALKDWRQRHEADLKHKFGEAYLSKSARKKTDIDI